MRYISRDDEKRARRLAKGAFNSCASIHATGSVRGMQKLYGWPRGGQVRIGSYIYNVGTKVIDVLRDRNLIKGE